MVRTSWVLQSLTRPPSVAARSTVAVMALKFEVLRLQGHPFARSKPGLRERGKKRVMTPVERTRRQESVTILP
jgi:hypothetical protein